MTALYWLLASLLYILLLIAIVRVVRGGVSNELPDVVQLVPTTTAAASYAADLSKLSGDWAKQNMIDELEDKKSKKSIWQKFLEGGASHAGSVIAGGAAGVGGLAVAEVMPRRHPHRDRVRAVSGAE